MRNFALEVDSETWRCAKPLMNFLEKFKTVLVH